MSDNEYTTDTNVEVVSETKTVKVKYDERELIDALCCANQFYRIKNVLPTLTKTEVKKLRDTLRSHTPSNHMNFHLEHVFRVTLGEE